jgi:hypothetical protein
MRRLHHPARRPKGRHGHPARPAATPAQRQGLPRRLTWLAWATVALAVVVLFGVWPLSGADLWMHVVVGRWTWQHGDVPRVDGFSYTTAGAEFIAHSWGSELLFYGVESAAGTAGFMILKCSLITAALGFALHTARSLGASWSALMLLAPVVLLVLWGRLECRPYLFTSLLLAVALWLLITIHVGRRSWRWLWALPPMCMLSINLHGGWPQLVLQLVAIMAAVGAMAIRRRWLGSGVASHLPLRHLALVLGACVLALLLNPYGLRLVTFPFDTMQAAWIRADAAEWRSAWTSNGWRLVAGGVFAPLFPVFAVYTALLGGALLGTLRRWRTADLVPLAAMGLWLGLSGWHLRAVGDTMVLTGPLVAAALDSTGWPARRRGPVWGGIVGLVGLIGLGVWAAHQDPGLDRMVPVPLASTRRWDRDEPICAAAAIARLGLSSGRVFAGGGKTGWLLYRFHPTVRVESTWEYVAGPGRWAELQVAWSGAPGTLRAHLDRYQVDGVLLYNHAVYLLTPELLAHGWVIVHQDNQMLVMMRRSRWQGPIYRYIRPGVEVPATVDQALPVLEEADRMLRHCPERATVAHAFRADSLLMLGREAEAREAARMIPQELVVGGRFQ